MPIADAMSCFDSPGDNGHSAFQKLWRFWHRYGTEAEDLELQSKSIEELQDVFARMTSQAVTGESWCVPGPVTVSKRRLISSSHARPPHHACVLSALSRRFRPSTVAPPLERLLVVP